MYVEALTLDGFKSYAKRTRIDKWDPYFNAITGLNGSGKSNLLDAICFVLGISTLSHVRASNFLDLVYKRGQAGVSKASATIVFNNEEKERSPPGYEDCPRITVTRQVIVNGRSKYIINGHNKNQHDVVMLFHSVQLNVNNPHFLIMQGKITQVLNMKPREVLSVIEEASGTRMFEDRKLKAMGILEKKDEKLREIYSLLETEIEPKLSKLREERRNLFEFQKIESELSNTKRLSKAFEYTNIMSKINKHMTEMSKNEHKLGSITLQKDALNAEVQRLSETIQQFTETMKMNSAKLNECRESSQEKSKQYTRLKAQSDICKANILDIQKKLSHVQGEGAELNNRLDEHKLTLHRSKMEFEKNNIEYDIKSRVIAEVEEVMQTHASGASPDTSIAMVYQTRLGQVKQKIAKFDLDINRCTMEMKHTSELLQEKLPLSQAAAASNSKALEELENIKTIINSINTELEGMESLLSQEKSLIESMNMSRKKFEHAKSKYEVLESKIQFSRFEYIDPSPAFDRSKVKGPAAYLFQVKEEHKAAIYALEVCAGSRLYNIVVEDENVASLIMKHGVLKKRHTFIPLNKIKPYTIDTNRLEAGRRLTNNSAKLAIELIEYDKSYEPAMLYVFGSTFICTDRDSARIAAFDQSVRVRAITLNGDMYDPSGQLTGGSKPRTNGILNHVSELQYLQSQVVSTEEELRKTENTLNELASIRGKCNNLKNSLELKKHEYDILNNAILSNPSSKLIEETENLESRLSQLKSQYANLALQKTSLIDECSRIERDIKDYSELGPDKFEELSQRYVNDEKILIDLRKKNNSAQRLINALSGEIAQLEIESAKIAENINNINRDLSQARAESDQLESVLYKIKSEINKIQNVIDTENAAHTSSNSNYNDMQSKIISKSEIFKSLDLDHQVLKIELEKSQKTLNDYNGALDRLIRENPWIPEQKDKFNQLGTEFDFSNVGNDLYNRIKYLSERYKLLCRIVDRDAADKFERVEKREAKLRHMINTVQRDRKKIQTTINALEKHKFEAIKRTWELVNEDFGAIFGDMLPGSNCKLQTLEGQDMTKGFEICVNLGGSWNKSLVELSGGQRSLVALSLILSLLKFKPAPIYILDEIDSALDISHTQNIGHLLKTRFKGSQFILVSLKEEMFNNANVVFRVKFRDGHTVVEVFIVAEVGAIQNRTNRMYCPKKRV